MLKLNKKYCIVFAYSSTCDWKYKIILFSDWEKYKNKNYVNDIVVGNTIKEVVTKLIEKLEIEAVCSEEIIKIQDLIKEIDSINYFYFI